MNITFFRPLQTTNPRVIRVSSSLAEIDEVSEPVEQNTVARQVMTPSLLQALKVFTVPMVAMLTSLSLPILIILVYQKLNETNRVSLAHKLPPPLIPYTFLVALRTWLLWNSLGHRLNGRVDAEIQPPDDQAENDTSRVFIALLANTAGFTSALLGGLLLRPDGPPQLLWPFSVILGGLSYTKDLFTEVVDAFRKHAESRHQLGQPVKPFFKQKSMVQLVNYAEYFGLALREMLPIISGIIHAQVATEAASERLANKASSETIMAIHVPLWLLIYWSAAYATRFELVQFRDNLQATGKQFVIENTCTQSSTGLVRRIGKISSGQVLIDMLRKLNLSIATSVNMTLVCAGIGQMALLHKALQTYVSSGNTVAVEAGNAGILMKYAVGQSTALRIAPRVEIAMASVAIALSALGTFAKSATLRKQAYDTALGEAPYQIGIALDDQGARPLEV